MAALFISDLHLAEHRPNTIRLTLSLLRNFAPRFDAVYILGDFIEYWIGDDYCHTDIVPVFEALSKLSAGGIIVRIMHGNRDFLISTAFTQSHGIELISDDEFVIDLFGKRTLLMHGDTLCTDDSEYQHFRRMVRSETWQSKFLEKSIEDRLTAVNKLRETSRLAIQDKATEIMDVNDNTVRERLQYHEATLLIHGHTHRPGKHSVELDNNAATRFVLGEWKDSAEILVATSEGCQLIRWPEDVPC